MAHGNEWTGLNFPAVAGGKRCAVGDIEAALRSETIRPLDNETIDRQTEVTVFGCDIGKDTVLLHALSLALGGADEDRPTVRSARFFNLFLEKNGKIERFWAENAFVAIPAGSFPGNRAIAQKLAEKYPVDPTDWRAALCRLRPENPSDPFVHYFNIPVRWTTVYRDSAGRPELCGPSDCLVWVKKQPELMATLQKMGLPPENFRWEMEASSISTPDGRTLPTISAEGQAIIYCVLKPVTEGEAGRRFFKPAATDGRYFASVR